MNERGSTYIRTAAISMTISAIEAVDSMCFLFLSLKSIIAVYKSSIKALKPITDTGINSTKYGKVYCDFISQKP